MSVSPAAMGRPASAPVGGVISMLTVPSAEMPLVCTVEPRGISVPPSIRAVTKTRRASRLSSSPRTSPTRTPLSRTSAPGARPCASSNVTTTS